MVVNTDLCEFKVSLPYKANSRTARATTQKNKKKKQKSVCVCVCVCARMWNMSLEGKLVSSIPLESLLQFLPA